MKNPSDTDGDTEQTNAIQRDDAGVSRRKFLLAGVGGTGLLGAAALGISSEARAAILGGGAQGPGPYLPPRPGAIGTNSASAHGAMHPMPAVVGEVDHVRNGFNPSEMLVDFDGGKVSTLPNGQTLREYTLVAQNKTIEVVPGVEFAAWTYNGRVPGPTIRVTEGDRVRITHLNASDHPHSLHFHGVHPGGMDGVFDMRSGVVAPKSTRSASRSERPRYRAHASAATTPAVATITSVTCAWTND